MNTKGKIGFLVMPKKNPIAFNVSVFFSLSGIGDGYAVVGPEPNGGRAAGHDQRSTDCSAVVELLV